MGHRRRPAALLAALALAGTAALPLSARAEWEKQRMNLQDQDMAFIDVCALGSSFAVAAGVIKQGSDAAAAVVATRDGMNWQKTSPVVTGIHIYLSCYFPDENHGYVGGIGEIWVTNDAAVTWTKAGLGGLFSGRAINGIDGLGSGRPAFAATALGQVLRTTDDGATWPEVARPLGDVNLGGVLFADDDHGWAYGGEAITDDAGEVTAFEGGGLARTTDGGETWEALFSGEAREVIEVRFVSPQRGWMLSRSFGGTVLERTTDGGETWEPAPLPTASVGGAINGFNDIFFFDACEGMLAGAVGQNDWGAVWRTRDGGETWVEFDREFLRLGQILGMPIEATLVGFDFASRDVGWATGSNETIFRYDADDDPPQCSGGGGGDGDGGGGRCSCRAVGGETRGPPLGALLVLALGLALGFGRRLWKG